MATPRAAIGAGKLPRTTSASGTGSQPVMAMEGSAGGTGGHRWRHARAGPAAREASAREASMAGSVDGDPPSGEDGDPPGGHWRRRAPPDDVDGYGYLWM
ncbi:hypothetical protein OsJ_11934 [Oryza sativa Japonica Group]|uniref:Uncharacterized protein n=1 Tax=Oryza sativa subsp. japonica TaxID=39947 RepID=B9FA29_ORYSJ|nr:hypothetical protein OsJ_11934 [Oryza sativa Japonica Group]